MRVEYLHASKYGNGAEVAAELGQQMATKGVMVHVPSHPGGEAEGAAPADLYLFSSPARLVKAFVARIPVQG